MLFKGVFSRSELLLGLAVLWAAGGAAVAARFTVDRLGAQAALASMGAAAHRPGARSRSLADADRIADAAPYVEAPEPAAPLATFGAEVVAKARAAADALPAGALADATPALALPDPTPLAVVADTSPLEGETRR
jgi:hypothetical protein